MDVMTVIPIAFGLAMDAFAVSIASGMTFKGEKVTPALKLGLCFGSFQALMPILGWLAGLKLRDLISGVDHWAAFVLLAFIGSKMIYESIKLGEERNERNPLNPFVLLMLSVATSIDALAVGLSFAFLKISISGPVMIIGVVTFVLSFFGVLIGSRLGHFFEKKMEMLGGLVLIGIGIKILVEHTL